VPVLCFGKTSRRTEAAGGICLTLTVTVDRSSAEGGLSFRSDRPGCSVEEAELNNHRRMRIPSLDPIKKDNAAASENPATRRRTMGHGYR